jgi:cell division protein FtsW
VRYHKPDYTLIIIVLALIVFGLIMLSSASVVMSYQMFGHNYYYFLRQLLLGGVFGLLGFFIISKIDYHRWKKFAPLFLIITLALLILVFIPQFNLEYSGARRWIHIGPLTMQPTEMAKLTFLLYLASWLDKRRKGIRDFQTSFVPFIFLLGVIGILIILQPDIGTLSIIALTAITVYFIAGAHFPHLLSFVISGVILFLILVKLAPYRMARFTVFLNPEIDPQGIGYQINQALLAIGSGGLFGEGLGKSIQKYNYLPEAFGDSIFAVIAEELGFIRVLIVVALFAILAYRGFQIAKNAPDLFGKLVAGGIISWISFQALINIAAMIGLIPLTGIPLPFISYGGTALLFALLGMGIVVNVSRQTR